MEVKQVIINKVDLKKLRKKTGLSAKELAKKSRVGYEHLVNCENGRLRMGANTWEKIKRVLDKYN